MSYTLHWEKKTTERIGEWLMRGAISALGRMLFLGLVLLAVGGVAINAVGRGLHLGPNDDSDASWSVRSGLTPRRDALTGCQYLETTGGYLAPRMAADGTQVCK